MWPREVSQYGPCESGSGWCAVRIRRIIFINLDAEIQRYLLGNAGTVPVGITSFHCHDDIDEFFFRYLRAWPTRALRRKQHAVLSFPQHVWRCRRVAGLTTMAERSRRDGPMKKVHRPAIM